MRVSDRDDKSNYKENLTIAHIVYGGNCAKFNVTYRFFFSQLKALCA